jgi:hypothetical protein
MSAPTTRDEFKEYCLKNKYSKWYFLLVEKADIRNWNKKTSNIYLEKHHIIPRAITKQKLSQGDVVHLTAKEHFVCHLLLTKMIDDKNIKNKMILALHRLVHGNNKKYGLSARTYEIIKKQHSIVAREKYKKYWNNFSKEERSVMKSGSNNSRYGIIMSKETKNKISLANKGKRSGENHHLWKLGHRKESIEKMKQNAGRPALGKEWFNDGVKNYLILPETNINFNKGRINIKTNHLKNILVGKKWFNDGKNSFLIFPNEQKEDYQLGRIVSW